MNQIATVTFKSILTRRELIRYHETNGASLYRETDSAAYLSLPTGQRLVIRDADGGGTVELSGPAPCQAWDDSLLTLRGHFVEPAKSRRVSDTLKEAWEILSDYPEILDALVEFERFTDELHTHDDGSVSNVEMAEALYWIGADYHGGQGCSLYRLTSALGYSPGMCQSEPENPELYNEIAEILS